MPSKSDIVIVLQDSLPGLVDSPKGILFQTDDFNNNQETYTITKCGKLLGPDGKAKDFHGLFQFWARVGGVFKCYEAKFTDGEWVSYRVLGD